MDAPSALALATTLPLWQAGSSLQVSIVFDPEDYGGAWSIDDLYIDPAAVTGSGGKLERA